MLMVPREPKGGNLSYKLQTTKIKDIKLLIQYKFYCFAVDMLLCKLYATICSQYTV